MDERGGGGRVKDARQAAQRNHNVKTQWKVPGWNPNRVKFMYVTGPKALKKQHEIVSYVGVTVIAL